LKGIELDYLMILGLGIQSFIIIKGRCFLLHPLKNIGFETLPRLDASQNLFYIKVKIGKTDR